MTAVNKKTIKDVLKGYPEVKEHSISGSTVFVFYQTEKDLETYRGKYHGNFHAFWLDH